MTVPAVAPLPRQTPLPRTEVPSIPQSAEAERPSSDPYLRAFLTAFESELSAATGRYHLSNRDRVLDVPCGDGFYTALLARHMLGG